MSARGSARDEILRKLSQAVPWPKGDAPRGGGARPGETPDRKALADLFEAKATAASAVVKRVASVAETAPQVVSFMKEAGVSSAVISGEEIIGAAGIPKALTKAGMEVISLSADPAAHKEACFTAGAGITGVAYGIAETGTLAMVFDKASPRLVSHAPFCHIALLRAEDVLPDTETLFARLMERKISPSALALVTGPSMTADIALTVVRGIHGPGKLLILLIG
jgi:L-lactate dehydrogenase complex protein LldG